MKKLILLLAAAACAVAQPTISGTPVSSTVSNSNVVTLSYTPTSGDAMVLVSGCRSNTGNSVAGWDMVPTITDTNGNAWQIVGYLPYNAAFVTAAVYSTIANSSTADTVTVTWPTAGNGSPEEANSGCVITGTNRGVTATLAGVHGMASTHMLDVWASAIASSTSQSVSVTTTNATDLVLGMVVTTGNETYTAGTCTGTCTIQAQSGNPTVGIASVIESQPATSAGTIATGFSLTANNGSVLFGVALSTAPITPSPSICTLAPITVNLSTSANSWMGPGCDNRIPGDNDFMKATLANLTWDTNSWGTAGSTTGLKWYAGLNAGFQVNCNQPHVIFFGSTGTNTKGTGSAATPGTDVTTTMFGFYFTGDKLGLGSNLACPSNTPTVYSPGNGTTSGTASVTYSTSPTTVTVGGTLPTVTSFGVVFSGSANCGALNPNGAAQPKSGVFIGTRTSSTTFTIPVDTSGCSSFWDGYAAIANGITIINANYASSSQPTYIRQVSNDFSQNLANAMVLTLDNVVIANGGTSTASGVQGAIQIGQSASTSSLNRFSMKRTHISTGSGGVVVGSTNLICGNTVTCAAPFDVEQSWSNNFTSPAVPASLYSFGTEPVTFLDNTDTNSLTASSYILGSSTIPLAWNVQRNAVFFPTAHTRGVISIGSGANASSVAANIQNNLCAEVAGAYATTQVLGGCIAVTGAATGITQVVGNIAEHSSESYGLGNNVTGNTPCFIGNWGLGDYVSPAQGVYFPNSASGACLSNNIWIYQSKSGGAVNLFYGSGSTTPAYIATGNVYDWRTVCVGITGCAAPQAGNVSLQVGEYGGTDFFTSATTVAGNIFNGGTAGCYSDGNATPSSNSHNVYTADTVYGVGLFRNFYSRDCLGTEVGVHAVSTNLVNAAATAHPSLAAYGEISGQASQFVDRYRTLAGFVAAIGGPSSIASAYPYLAQTLAARSGWTGPSTGAVCNGAFNSGCLSIIPAALSYLTLGHVSANPQTFGSGYNGTDMGAVSPGVPRRYPSLGVQQ